MATNAGALKGHGVVAVIERDGRFLMIQRALRVRAGGYWCFVGGAMETGETQKQALVREVSEEIGMTIEPGEKVWQCLSYNKDWLLHCWTAIPTSDQLRLNPAEVADVAWMTPAEIQCCPQVLPSVLDFLRFQNLLS